MNIHAKFGSTIGEVVLEKILKTDKTLFDEKGLLFLSCTFYFLNDHPINIPANCDVFLASGFKEEN